MKKKLYKLTNGHCAYCGRGLKFAEMTVDHVMPLSKGGNSGMTNYLPACRKCNSRKSNFTLEEYRSHAKKLGYCFREDLFYFEVMPKRPRGLPFRLT